MAMGRCGDPLQKGEDSPVFVENEDLLLPLVLGGLVSVPQTRLRP